MKIVLFASFAMALSACTGQSEHSNQLRTVEDPIGQPSADKLEDPLPSSTEQYLEKISACEKEAFADSEASLTVNGGNVILVESLRTHFEREFLKVFVLVNVEGEYYVDEYSRNATRDEHTGLCKISSSFSMQKTWDIQEFTASYVDPLTLNLDQVRASYLASHVCKKSIVKQWESMGHLFADAEELRQLRFSAQTSSSSKKFIIKASLVSENGLDSQNSTWEAEIKEIKPFQQDFFWDDPCALSFISAD
jgi:hypothetical protein